MKHLLISLLTLAAALVCWRQASRSPSTETEVGPAPVVVKTPPRKHSAPSPSTGLNMPQPEPCIPFDADPGDEGMVAPGGLDRGQVKQALDAVLGHALACGTEGSYEPVFELLIGCDGVMRSVMLTDGGGADPAITDCIAKVLRHADFPPHDMADGMTVPYPVRVEF